MRGTSGTPRHTKLTRYRCSLPGLAGFAGNRCTEPEVPPIDGLRRKLFSRCDRSAESSTAFCLVKGCAYYETAVPVWNVASMFRRVPADCLQDCTVLPLSARPSN